MLVWMGEVGRWTSKGMTFYFDKKPMLVKEKTDGR